MYDVIVIGGSFAGLSAALQLGRARRDVLVIDGGLHRNRFAHAANGLLGHDGKSPTEILETARKEFDRYPTVQFRKAFARTAIQTLDGFTVETDDGTITQGRRIILAIGVSDTLPEIPGLRERWGTSVFHCPYCHGFEVAGRRFGVIANNEMAGHQAALVTEWSDDVVVFADGFEVEASTGSAYRIEPRAIASIEGMAGEAMGVRLVDGTEIPVDAIFTSPRTAPVGDIAQQLGCEIVSTVLGEHIVVTGPQMTSVPNVFAAGDATRMASNLAGAIADGAMAGVSAHRSLVFEAVAR